tara:strand:- start:1546 stop:1743 length:198 start_codon:yes stop_codon:yes gene_type:complete
MARRYRRFKSYSKPKRRRRRRKQTGMKKAHKDMLQGAGVATALLIFIPTFYLSIAKALGREGAVE